MPEATPEPPVEVLHVTSATPMLDCAVPLTIMEPEDVATMVMGGDRMLIAGGEPEFDDGVVGLDGGFEGGVPPEPPEMGVSVGGVCSVTVTLADAWFCFAS